MAGTHLKKGDFTMVALAAAAATPMESPQTASQKPWKESQRKLMQKELKHESFGKRKRDAKEECRMKKRSKSLRRKETLHRAGAEEDERI